MAKNTRRTALLEKQKSPLPDLVDTALIIGVGSGLLFMCGYAYFSGYLAAAGVQLHAVKLEPKLIAVQGAATLSDTVGWFLAAYLAVLFAIQFGKRGRKIRLSPSRPAVVLSFLVIYAVIQVKFATEQGEEAAHEVIKTGCLQTDVTYLPKGATASHTASGCLVLQTENGVWIRARTKGPEQDAVTYIPASSVLTTVRNVLPGPR